MSRRGRIVRRTLGALAGLLAVGAVGGYWYERPLLLTGTGYAAHNACAVRQVAGREDPTTDLPPNPLVPYLREAREGEKTTGSLWGRLARQQAWYAGEFGCVLAGERPDFGKATIVGDKGNPLAGQPVPTAKSAVRSAIATAFGDDLPPAQRAELGTRAIVVVHKGRIVGERYGEGFDPSTPQLGWSMAKSVTSLLTGRLAVDGTLSLQDAGLRPEWKDEKARITLEQLLRMTSGLQWDETYALGTPVTTMLYREPDMGAYAAGLDLEHPPGSFQQYSSGSTNIVCDYLQERSGLGPDLPRQLLFTKLGLSSAVWEVDAGGTPVCSSYLWASARDWATIGQFALQGGQWNGEQLLPAEWMDLTTSAVRADQTQEPGYAAGWWSNRIAGGGLVEEGVPADAYWMQGHDGQRVVVIPSADLVVVRLGFTPQLDSAQLRVMPLVADLVAALQ